MIKSIKEAWRILNKDSSSAITWAAEHEKYYEFYIRGKDAPVYAATGLNSFLINKSDGAISTQYLDGDYSPLGKKIREYKTEEEIKEIES